MSDSQKTFDRRPTSRRRFLKRTGMAMAFANLPWSGPVAGQAAQKSQSEPVPWFQRTLRWGQTNITEGDPPVYDIAWWRDYWKRTRVQGVILNAGGIVAYYPSKDPLEHRAEKLGDRDLYGELAAAAHQDGLAVLARMDSNRAHEAFYRAHPDWFARDAAGQPYKTGDLYITCINSPYYERWIPAILQEIVERTHPEGFTDNSWSGLGRGSICYCEHCTRQFRVRSGKALPSDKNWDSPVYRAWIQWNYDRRLEVWEQNNAVTKAAGGPHCLWIGMNSGSISSQCQSFRPFREICQRAEIIMLDHQARSEERGFGQNGEAGKLIHGLLGWNKLIPESMAMYQAGRPTFRRASKPPAEARLWIYEGVAGGLQPWWHHVGAVQEDRRQFQTILALARWHERNQQYLGQRQPVANVGVAWSQQHTDFYGRDHAEDLVDLPFYGLTSALVRARIPYLPVHLDDLDRLGAGLKLLVLPNLAALSNAQAERIRAFVAGGGNLLATGESSACDEWGAARPDFALADLFGAHLPAGRPPLNEATRSKRAKETLHTYLRLDAKVTQRHPVLLGFNETDILPFGGALEPFTIAENVVVPLTYIPPSPIYPPETAWMREPRTTIPGLVLNTTLKGSRIAFLPADLDRRYGRDHLPDHGDLLANVVRWTLADDLPLQVKGPGMIDCHLYRQQARLILHLVNLTGAGSSCQPVEESIPVGPLAVRVQTPAGLAMNRLQLLVAEKSLPVRMRDGWATFEIAALQEHEVVVLD